MCGHMKEKYLYTNSHASFPPNPIIHSFICEHKHVRCTPARGVLKVTLMKSESKVALAAHIK